VSVSTTTFTGFLYLLPLLNYATTTTDEIFFFSKMKRRYFSQALPYYLFLIWNKTFIQMKTYAFLDNVAIQNFSFYFNSKEMLVLNKKNFVCAT
jgi:energy-coupling factor transporter transmembrane protein EcfT